MQRKFSRALPMVAAAVVAGLGSLVRADNIITSITPGDLIVLRGGDASYSNASTTGNAFNGEVAAYLDEYTTSGQYVGTIDVDSSGDANTLTLPGYGQFQHEGALNVAGTDGQYITFGGYNYSPSTTIAANTLTGASAVGHNIGVLNLETGTLDTSTQVNGVYNSTNPYFRGAVASNSNATAFYTFGKYPNGGLEYVNGTGASPAITPIESYADVREAQVVNGQLYIGSGSSSAANGEAGGHSLYTVAGGAPTSQLHTSTQNEGVDNTQVVEYNGNVDNAQSVSNFAFANIPGGGAVDPTSGANVLYTIGDQGTTPDDSGSIVKYSWNTTSDLWVSDGVAVYLNANDVLNPVGLSVVPVPGNPSDLQIFVSGENGLYSYTDTSGNAQTPLPSIADVSDFTQLVNLSSSNEAFYGVAYAAVPEPASVGLIAVSAFGLLARRRNRKA